MGEGSTATKSPARPYPPLQKIMHTRKRHQDMFQDLNRKLQQHAEKEKEVLGAESKVWGGACLMLGASPGHNWGWSPCWRQAGNVCR